MNIKEIKYIGFYDNLLSPYKRFSALSAINKMNYVIDTLIKEDFRVNLISPSWIDDRFIGEKRVKSLADVEKQNFKITFVPSFKTKFKLLRKFKIFFSLSWLFFWLLLNVKRNEKIMVYHSIIIMFPVVLAKKLIGFKIILEIEEIYSDAQNLSKNLISLEKKLIKEAHSYLLSTELLKCKIDTEKHSIVVYGNYNYYEKLNKPPSDDKIYIVYAGIIDSQKAGAFNAIECALFLSEKYEINIIGFGEVEKLKFRISQINKNSRCKVFYKGIKTGSVFIEFCQSFHIGLSTQKMDGEYLNSSFPSKVLSYLGMGLRVVSCHIECISKSKIGDLVTYYYEDNPESIANAIKKIDISKDFDFNKIKELDEQFTFDLKMLFSD
jgi:predicted CoA-binding protein